MELFQTMTEMGLEPLINEGLADGDFYARRTVMDAIGRTGRMSVLPYLIKGMEDEDKYTRWQAAKGLGRYAGSNEAREALNVEKEGRTHVNVNNTPTWNQNPSLIILTETKTKSGTINETKGKKAVHALGV